MCVRPIGRETVASPPSAIGLTLCAALETSSTDRETHSTECETNSTDLETHSTEFVTNSTHLKTHSTERETNSTHLETHSTDFVTKSSDIVTNSSDIEGVSEGAELAQGGEYARLRVASARRTRRSVAVRRVHRIDTAGCEFGAEADDPIALRKTVAHQIRALSRPVLVTGSVDGWPLMLSSMKTLPESGKPLQRK